MGAFRSLERLRRIDRGIARVEGALAVFVLLSMVLVASLQALFFNIAEQGIGWGRVLLDGVSWADPFLQKGTLWLAFLGASLATHQNKHIAIDVLPRLVSGRLKRALGAFASLGAGLIAFLLAWVFFQACLVADAAVPFEYELLIPEGTTHICDGSPSELGNVDRPLVLCALRGGLAALQVSVSSGSGIAQLIAPVMFAVIGMRLLARFVALLLKLETDSTDDGGTASPAKAEASEAGS